MDANHAIVEDLTAKGFLLKWKSTLGHVRQLCKSTARGSRWNMATRLSSLAPIKRPVFILGCPRSGTTFLGDVMESLPSSSYYFEPSILKYYSRLVYTSSVSPTKARWLYHAVLRSLLLIAPGPGRRIIEKNPKHTWIAKQLLSFFPDAQFIFIHRDGRDVALSLAAKPWHQGGTAGQGKREPGGYLYGPYPHFYIEPHRHSEYEATTDYHRAIWIWRQYAEQMERLRNELPLERQFHLSYEALVRSPASTLKPLLEFLGESDQSIEHAMKIAKEGHTSSVGKWRKQLDAESTRTTMREAGEMLRVLGYLESETTGNELTLEQKHLYSEAPSETK